MKNKSRRKKSNYEEITSLKTLTIKYILARRGLRQRSLDDELGRRILASARWLGERRTPGEQAVLKNTYNRGYGGIRQAVGEGKTTALSARTAEAPTRSATMGLGRGEPIPRIILLSLLVTRDQEVHQL